MRRICEISESCVGFSCIALKPFFISKKTFFIVISVYFVVERLEGYLVQG
jgi:hypothetical protein